DGSPPVARSDGFLEDDDDGIGEDDNGPAEDALDEEDDA
ncbi:MAG: hypothetical protein QOC86_26, partial [Gaiellales bacterium]|nr:hypothetical protein [Gaiellales bacterium]